MLPLNMAIERGNEGIIRILIEAGKPNLSRRDSFGKSPLHYAG